MHALRDNLIRESNKASCYADWYHHACDERDTLLDKSDDCAREKRSEYEKKKHYKAQFNEPLHNTIRRLCYMNSVVQVLYDIIPLREEVIHRYPKCNGSERHGRSAKLRSPVATAINNSNQKTRHSRRYHRPLRMSGLSR